MAVTERQKEYCRRRMEKLDCITIRPPKGTKDRWRGAAEAQGQSLTQFIPDTVELATAQKEEEKRYV